MTHAWYEGLIANTEKGNEGDIQLVENVVSDYISRDSCLILLTIACECEAPFLSLLIHLFTQRPGDFMTQKSYQLAQKHDPTGARTIGQLFCPVSWFKLTVVFFTRCPHQTRQMPCGVWGSLARFRTSEAHSNTQQWMVRGQTSGYPRLVERHHVGGSTEPRGSIFL